MGGWADSARPGKSVGGVLASATSALAYVNTPALAATILWAGNKTALKVALVELDPIVVGVIRMAVAGLLLVVYLAFTEESPWLPWRAWPKMLAIGSLGLGLNTLLFLEGLQLTTVTTTALLMTTSPVFCLAIAVAIRQERLALRSAAGVVVALIGVAVLLGTDVALGSAQGLLADCLLLGAAVAWAGYSVFGGRVLQEFSSVKTTAYTLLAAAATIAVASPLMVRSWDLGGAGVLAWSAVAYTAVLASVVGFSLWNAGIRRRGATQTMVYTYLAPVIAILSAAVVLGESPKPEQLVGGGIVLLGLGLSASRRKA